MSLAQEGDVEVIARISDEAEISRISEETKPQFLIVSLESHRFGRLAREAILHRHPEMQILALASDGNSFTLFSASDGIRSMIYKVPETEILNVMRSNSRIRESGQG